MCQFMAQQPSCAIEIGGTAPAMRALGHELTRRQEEDSTSAIFEMYFFKNIMASGGSKYEFDMSD